MTLLVNYLCVYGAVVLDDSGVVLKMLLGRDSVVIDRCGHVPRTNCVVSVVG